jgi:hypothetical protein
MNIKASDELKMTKKLFGKFYVGPIFFIIPSEVGLSSPGTAATTGLLYQPQMIDDGDCGAIGEMKIGRGNRSTRRKPTPEPLCPTQIPHDQTRARTQAAGEDVGPKAPSKLGTVHIDTQYLDRAISDPASHSRDLGFRSRSVGRLSLIHVSYYFQPFQGNHGKEL